MMVPVPKKSTKRENGDKTSPSKRRDEHDWAQYNHLPPSQTQLAKNGRQKGRNLITWNRPRMYEKLLLHIQYECARHRVDIPWDNIAHRFHPGSSGNAISQHLTRLRQNLVTEGHLVPPPLPKSGGPKQDPKIRGFARKHINGSNHPTATEAVGWNEPFEDRRKNFPDAADYFDEESDSIMTSMSGDEAFGSADFEDLEMETDTNDLAESGAKGNSKGKMPVKRQSSDDHNSCDAVEKKKVRTSVRPSRAATMKISYLDCEGDVSETETRQGDGEPGMNAAEATADDKDKYTGTSANEYVLSRSILTANSLPDPFVAGSTVARQSRTFSRNSATTIDAVSPFQTQLQPSPAYSPLSPNRRREGPVTTPSPIRAFPATLMVSPTGQAWTVPNVSLAGQLMQVANTPRGSSAFATANSSPANFDFENATPRTAAAMRSHLDEWNDVPSVFTDIDKFEQQVQRSVEKRNKKKKEEA